MQRSIISIAFILLGYAQSGNGIKCWECNSKYDPNCGDPFKSSTLAMADCTQRFLAQDHAVESTICRKLSQKVQGEERVIRSCGYLEPQEAGTCFNRAGTHNVFVEYCQCTGDGCNKAGHIHQPAHLLLYSAAIIMALMFLLS